MKPILLLGKGYIGTTLEQTLKQNGFTVDAYSRNQLDYTSPVALQKHIKERNGEYEAVINCSGYTGFPNVDGCEKNKQDCWFWNVIVPRNIVLSSNAFTIPTIQVSSGCIYTGHEKEFTEEDEPNFGLFNNNSSFYSKTKHACETIFQNCYGYILRIRMPFDSTLKNKNYLNKLYKYNTLISQKNSLTSTSDLNAFICKFLYLYKTIPSGPINVVNPGALDAREIVELLKKYEINNPEWKFIDLKDLDTVAQRSNCILSTERLRQYNLELPPAVQSLERDIAVFARNVFSK
jgi:dTDP-4-dehydrorhamnose reductase